MMLYTMPVFLVVVFAGGAVAQGGWGALLGLVIGLGVLVVTIVVRNTTSRVRTVQAVRFFWGPMTVAALVALALASGGW